MYSCNHLKRNQIWTNLFFARPKINLEYRLREAEHDRTAFWKGKVYFYQARSILNEKGTLDFIPLSLDTIDPPRPYCFHCQLQPLAVMPTLDNTLHRSPRKFQPHTILFGEFAKITILYCRTSQTFCANVFIHHRP